jgi:hypothetical protein
LLNLLLRDPAPFVASSPFVLAVVAFLVVWALSSAVFLIRATGKIRSAFITATRHLEQDDDPIVLRSATK